MRFLLIDTCGSEGSVALADTDKGPAVIASERLPGRSSSERLMPAVRRAMEGSDRKLKELTAIVVVHGPGSFTGVRVGLSAAKGLSEAGGIPLIAVSRLALLAAGAGEPDQRVVAVVDAGRGEFYLGEYVGHSCLREVLADAVEVEITAAGAALFVCEPRTMETLVRLQPRIVREPSAEDALPFAVERAASGEFDDVAVVDANYLRRTDAQIFAKPKPKDAAL